MLKGCLTVELQSEKSVFSLIKALVKTIATAFLITVILMAILALCICYTPLPEEMITPCVYILNYLSVFLAGLITATKTKTKGFISGGLAGCGYMLLVYLLGFVLFGGIDFSKTVLLTVLYCTLVGMTGGIVGINLNRG